MNSSHGDPKKSPFLNKSKQVWRFFDPPISTNQPFATGPLNLGVERFAEFLGPKLCATSPTKKRTKARHLGLCKIIGGIFKISKLGETFSSWVKTSPKTNGFVHPKQRPLKVWKSHHSTILTTWLGFFLDDDNLLTLKMGEFLIKQHNNIIIKNAGQLEIPGLLVTYISQTPLDSTQRAKLWVFEERFLQRLAKKITGWWLFGWTNPFEKHMRSRQIGNHFQ